LEHLSGLVNKANSARELAEILVQVESAITSGFLGKPWSKDRKQWIEACEVEDLSFPMFALLLFMLEFSVDRYYNPKVIVFVCFL
jgi:hypothetical protein